MLTIIIIVATIIIIVFAKIGVVAMRITWGGKSGVNFLPQKAKSGTVWAQRMTLRTAFYRQMYL